MTNTQAEIAGGKAVFDSLRGDTHNSQWEVGKGLVNLSSRQQQRYIDIYRAAIEAHTAALKDAGMVIVPKEPRTQQRRAGLDALVQVDPKYSHVPLSAFYGVYKAMIAASQESEE